MRCPYCNNEMKDGYVQSARQIFFTVKPHKIFFVGSQDDETILSNYNLTSPTVKAYRCKKCEKVIIDYSNE